MTDTVIPQESAYILRQGLLQYVETTYRDAGDGTLVIGEDVTREDDKGNVISFEHFDLYRLRWQ